MKLTQKEFIKIIREVQGRTEEDGESFELDVRHYRLKDEYGEATVGYPKRYEDNLRVRNKLYSEYDHINEFTMGVYLMNDVNDGKIKTKKELELAIDELASYYKKIRIRKDPELTFLQKIGEEPIDTRPTHRPIDKDKIRTEFEKAMKDSRELDLRSRRPHAGLHSIDSSLMYQRTGKFNESYIKQVIKEELEAVLAEKKKKRKKAGTESSKESSLRDWFKRKGGKGSSSGWVDCNTCRKGKCKSCGRKSGEKRSKYPSCRPTPAACKERGRGKSWGKKSARKKK